MHPDISILLTTLAYYHDGLTKQQFREASVILLTLGYPAKEFYYEQWIKGIQHTMSPDVRSVIGDVKYLDLSNSIQFQILYDTLHNSTHAINFWLNRVVLRHDTAQYPQRISSTTWNLSTGRHAVGFSGTKDNHRLLPLQVQQLEPPVESLIATDGKMLHYLIQHTLKFETVQDDPLWRNLLIKVVEEKFDALIDTGSLLAGVSNQSAAEFITTHCAFDLKFRGVCYFNVDSAKWTIFDRETRQPQEKSISPIRERDTFVLFDDARTRGADMKLDVDAIAALTLGPKLTKEKLMQGAGRMRQLGSNQKLVLIGTVDVKKQIEAMGTKKDAASTHLISAADNSNRICTKLSVNAISINLILEWVVENTTKSNQSGLLQWARQGISFSHSGSDPIDEDWTLESLFKQSVTTEPVSMTVQRLAKFFDPNNSNKLTQAIRDQTDALGAQVEVLQSSHEEVERELQLEEDNEEELEKEVASVTPMTETRWDYDQILKVTNVSELRKFVRIECLADAIPRMLEPKSLALINWSDSRVMATENFLTTIEIPSSNQVQNDYIRVADMALIIGSKQKDTDVVLLSDMEADGILQVMWGSPTSNAHIRLVNVCQLRNSMDHGEQKLVMEVNSNSSHLNMSEKSIAAIQLFNGETVYKTKSRQEALSELVSNHQAKAALLEIVSSRGKMSTWSCSQLEDLAMSIT